MCSRQESPATNLCPGSADDAKGCLGTASRSQKLLRHRSGVRFLHTQCEGIALSTKITLFFCSRQESNLHQLLRREPSYPLNDEGERLAYHSVSNKALSDSPDSMRSIASPKVSPTDTTTTLSLRGRSAEIVSVMKSFLMGESSIVLSASPERRPCVAVA